MIGHKRAFEIETIAIPLDKHNWLTTLHDKIITIDNNGNVMFSTLSGVSEELDKMRAQIATLTAAADGMAEALKRYGDKKNYTGHYASGPHLTGNMDVKAGVFVAKPWDLANNALTAYRKPKESK